jgi:DNA-binding NarL/FixJ family response regulator
MEPLRVLIADDHVLFRDGMRALLGAVPDLELIGEASTGQEAVDLSAQLHPDVVVMDIQMPGTSGIEATRRIVQQRPETRVLVVTMFEDDNTVFAAMRAGARGYVPQRLSLAKGLYGSLVCYPSNIVCDLPLHRRVSVVMEADGLLARAPARICSIPMLLISQVKAFERGGFEPQTWWPSSRRRCWKCRRPRSGA